MRFKTCHMDNTEKLLIQNPISLTIRSQSTLRHPLHRKAIQKRTMSVVSNKVPAIAPNRNASLIQQTPGVPAGNFLNILGWFCQCTRGAVPLPGRCPLSADRMELHVFHREEFIDCGPLRSGPAHPLAKTFEPNGINAASSSNA